MTDTATDNLGLPPLPGDNKPPADANPLQDRLAEEYASTTDRLAELLSAAERTPDTVEDEETNKRFATLAKLFQSLIKKAKAERVAEKDFYLHGGRQVDGWFNPIIAAADEAKISLEDRQTVYQDAKAAEELRVRMELERKAREEADRLAREAAQRERDARDAKSLDDAIAAEEAAKKAAAKAEVAAKAAAAKPADLSRTRSDEGAVASLRTWWDFRDLDRSRLDLEALRYHLPEDALEKAVKSFIRAGGRKLDGVAIFENSRTVNH